MKPQERLGVLRVASVLVVKENSNLLEALFGGMLPKSLITIDLTPKYYCLYLLPSIWGSFFCLPIRDITTYALEV